MLVTTSSGGEAAVQGKRRLVQSATILSLSSFGDVSFHQQVKLPLDGGYY